MVHDPLALQPLGHTRTGQEVDGSLLEDAGADSVLDVVAAAGLQHDRLDPLAAEQERQREPRGACADYPHLCAHHPAGAGPVGSGSASTRCAIAKALLAAGTPQ